jgi:hypothetical protein
VLEQRDRNVNDGIIRAVLGVVFDALALVRAYYKIREARLRKCIFEMV